MSAGANPSPKLCPTMGTIKSALSASISGATVRPFSSMTESINCLNCMLRLRHTKGYFFKSSDFNVLPLSSVNLFPAISTSPNFFISTLFKSFTAPHGVETNARSAMPFLNCSIQEFVEPVLILNFTPGNFFMWNSSKNSNKNPYSAVTVVARYTVPLSTLTARLTSSSPFKSWLWATLT